jgi:2-polyprenyl-6-methoxyphenol hydroxylase-like FAD-dependent oxidoreductase
VKRHRENKVSASGVRVELVRRERLEGTTPELKPEWLDVAAEMITTEFVVAADGRDSAVRKALGIKLLEYGERETYVFYDAPDTCRI